MIAKTPKNTITSNTVRPFLRVEGGGGLILISRLDPDILVFTYVPDPPKGIGADAADALLQ